MVDFKWNWVKRYKNDITECDQWLCQNWTIDGVIFRMDFFLLLYRLIFWFEKKKKKKKQQKMFFFFFKMWKCITRHWISFGHCGCVKKFLGRRNCACYEDGKKIFGKARSNGEKNGSAHFANEFYIITLLWHNGPHTHTQTERRTRVKNYRSVVFFIAYYYIYIIVESERERESINTTSRINRLQAIEHDFDRKNVRNTDAWCGLRWLCVHLAMCERRQVWWVLIIHKKKGKRLPHTHKMDVRVKEYRKYFENIE